MAFVWSELVVSEPPAWAMNAPTRSYCGLIVRPRVPRAVSFLATVVSWSQVVGMSLSVRPAACQSAVLMNSASVEKSLGAQ